MNVNFRMKSTVRIYITGVIFLKFPQITFIRTYVIIPIRIPFEMESIINTAEKRIIKISEIVKMLFLKPFAISITPINYTHR